jgi:ankyrin repeat protein
MSAFRHHAKIHERTCSPIVSTLQDRGFTALHSAVHFSNLDAVRMLISAGAEIVNVLDTV